MSAVTCGQHHAPWIQNATEKPILLSVRYANGHSFTQEFPPHSIISSPAEGIAIEELEVRADGKLLFTLNGDELIRLRSTLAPQARVVWEIRADGVTPKVIPE
jgi:hypothetical protein